MKQLSVVGLIFLNSLFNSGLVRANGNDINNNMTLVGQLNSKSYYEDKVGKNVHWVEANDMCQEAGLEMANYENAQEYHYLYDIKHGNDYWVAGTLKGFDVDSTGSIAAFEWKNGHKISDDVNFHHSYKTWLCLYFSGDDHTKVDFCIDGRHKVLCQTKSKGIK